MFQTDGNFNTNSALINHVESAVTTSKVASSLSVETIKLTRRLAFSAAMLVLSTPSFADGLKVVEMFTSQGCYSCPAADKLLGELAEQDNDILNLEFHVDYWNQLKYRGEGNWEDPFSSAEFTKRQRQYSSLNLKGENGVYTPQAVINGVYGQVGSNRRAMTKGLAMKVDMPVSVSIKQQDDATLNVSVDTEGNFAAYVYLVSFLKRTETVITSGENHDKVMVNHNVVTDMQPVASLAEANGQVLRVAYKGGENRGCAVLIQPEGQGAMLGAARCP